MASIVSTDLECWLFPDFLRFRPAKPNLWFLMELAAGTKLGFLAEWGRLAGPEKLLQPSSGLSLNCPWKVLLASVCAFWVIWRRKRLRMAPPQHTVDPNPIRA